MQNYSTLLDAIQGLEAEGYTEDFNLNQYFVKNPKTSQKFNQQSFKIDKHFRFDEDSDPSNQSIIYAISSKRYHLKGILINAHGIYAESSANLWLEKLHTN
ncbi:MAG: phosphoribosylpyrophosphate synthetase [Runella zeae]